MSTDGRGWVYEIRVHSRLSVVQDACGHEGRFVRDTRFRGICSVVPNQKVPRLDRVDPSKSSVPHMPTLMLAVTMGGMWGTLDFAEFARSSLGTLCLGTADEH